LSLWFDKIKFPIIESIRNDHEADEFRHAEFAAKKNKTRRERFLAEMEQVVP